MHFDSTREACLQAMDAVVQPQVEHSDNPLFTTTGQQFMPLCYSQQTHDGDVGFDNALGCNALAVKNGVGISQTPSPVQFVILLSNPENLAFKGLYIVSAQPAPEGSQEGKRELLRNTSSTLL